jgi:hypothetical protein
MNDELFTFRFFVRYWIPCLSTNKLFFGMIKCVNINNPSLIILICMIVPYISATHFDEDIPF